MKYFVHIPKLTGLLSLMLLCSVAFAQTPSGSKIDKELKSVMKELPADMRLQVLEYAQRKLEVKKRLDSSQLLEEAKAAETQVQTPAVEKELPQQAKAKPVPMLKPSPTSPNALEIKPSGTASPTASTPALPTTPTKPSYLEEAQSLPITKVEWEETTYDFGTRKTGEVVKYTYKFKNVGDQPLKLTRVKASCGCTTPNYSKAEIGPGEEGFIDVSFNSSGKSGPQTKTITVTGNFEPTNMVLRLRGTLEKPGSSE